MSEAAERSTGIAEFGRLREEFERGYQAVPDEALGYVPAGEDYTIGGLAVHVTDALYHYAHVLDVLKEAGYKEVRAVDPEDDAKRRRDAMVATGFPGSERTAVFAEMKSAHEALAAKLTAIPETDYNREVPVYYGADAKEPYPTHPADVLGWVVDHYRDHTQQVADLMNRWKQERA